QHQRLQQVRPLCPDAGLVGGVAAIRRSHRLLDTRDVRGQIGVADKAAVLATPGVDLTGDRAAVEVVGNQSQATAAIPAGAFLGVDHSPDRVREIGVPV